MKKILIIVFIAGLLISCGGGITEEEPTTDKPIIPVASDVKAVNSATVDSASTDSVTTEPVDTPST